MTRDYEWLDAAVVLFALGIVAFIAAVLSYAVSDVLTQRNSRNAMERGAQYGALSVQINGVVHELQKERGLSAGFIGSRGERFKTELGIQHQDTDKAVSLHLTQELGVDPDEKPSPKVAAVSSFVMFSIGAVLPLIPYLLGFESLTAGLLVGAAGLILVGGLAARITGRPIWKGALRQLLFGVIAAGATYLVGFAIGVPAGG